MQFYSWHLLALALKHALEPPGHAVDVEASTQDHIGALLEKFQSAIPPGTVNDAIALAEASDHNWIPRSDEMIASWHMIKIEIAHCDESQFDSKGLSGLRTK